MKFKRFFFLTLLLIMFSWTNIIAQETTTLSKKEERKAKWKHIGMVIKYFLGLVGKTEKELLQDYKIGQYNWARENSYLDRKYPSLSEMIKGSYWLNCSDNGTYCGDCDKMRDARQAYIHINRALNIMEHPKFQNACKLDGKTQRMQWNKFGKYIRDHPEIFPLDTSTIPKSKNNEIGITIYKHWLRTQKNILKGCLISEGRTIEDELARLKHNEKKIENDISQLNKKLRQIDDDIVTIEKNLQVVIRSQEESKKNIQVIARQDKFEVIVPDTVRGARNIEVDQTGFDLGKDCDSNTIINSQKVIKNIQKEYPLIFKVFIANIGEVDELFVKDMNLGKKSRDYLDSLHAVIQGLDIKVLIELHGHSDGNRIASLLPYYGREILESVKVITKDHTESYQTISLQQGLRVLNNIKLAFARCICAEEHMDRQLSRHASFEYIAQEHIDKGGQFRGVDMFYSLKKFKNFFTKEKTKLELKKQHLRLKQKELLEKKQKKQKQKNNIELKIEEKDKEHSELKKMITKYESLDLVAQRKVEKFVHFVKDLSKKKKRKLRKTSRNIK